jgi:hypothetical protein
MQAGLFSSSLTRASYNPTSCDITRRDFLGEANNRFATSCTVFSDISGLPPPCSFGFKLFHYKLNAAFRRRVSATKLFNKPPLAILNGTSNPIGLHKEHSLFQRISIHLHYDVKKASTSHLSSRLSDNASGKQVA